MKYLFYILTIIIFTACANQNKISQNNLIIEFHFQDGFYYDTVSTNINNCGQISTRIISSNKIIGVSDLNIKILKNGLSYLIKTNADSLQCPEFGKEFNIEILVNGEKNYIKINSRLGKFIGLSKYSDDSLIVNQSQKPFVYF